MASSVTTRAWAVADTTVTACMLYLVTFPIVGLLARLTEPAGGPLPTVPVAAAGLALALAVLLQALGWQHRLARRLGLRAGDPRERVGFGRLLFHLARRDLDARGANGRFRCPSCGATLRIPASSDRTAGRCGDCGAKVAIPSADDTSLRTGAGAIERHYVRWGFASAPMFLLVVVFGGSALGPLIVGFIGARCATQGRTRLWARRYLTAAVAWMAAGGVYVAVSAIVLAARLR
jgi:hypothetical protein